VGIGDSVDHDESRSLLSNASTDGLQERRRAGLLLLDCIFRWNKRAGENIEFTSSNRFTKQKESYRDYASVAAKFQGSRTRLYD
jgi:hypothetical protein